MRRRMLNPDFFTDPDIVSLDPFGRLFYQGLWCVADDSGCFELNALYLKMKIFPGDNISLDDIQGYIDTLIKQKKLITYHVDGKDYAWLKNFFKHQKLDKPSPPTVPLPPWVKFHGEEEFGNQRHKWYYEIIEPVGDNSRTCRGNVVDETTPEVNRSEVKRSEEEEKYIKSDSSNPTSPTPTNDTSLVFEHWNSKSIIRHRRLTDKFRRSIKAALKSYTLDEIKTAIDNYERVPSGPEFYWTHKWTLKEFLDRGLEKFLDWDVCVINYSIKKGDKPNAKSRGDPVQNQKADQTDQYAKYNALFKTQRSSQNA